MMSELHRYIHNAAVWAHYTLVLCGIVFVTQFSYAKFREYFPTAQEQIADAVFNQATKEWRK